ncbi:hypothetical protein LDENG_00056000 [Lucifuga dentata]|nr:hypothetical protein LDENG_00056000 [Lucifuga dentata]
MKMMIHAFISFHLDDYNELFTCLNKASLNCLQIVQNTAAKLPGPTGELILLLFDCLSTGFQ